MKQNMAYKVCIFTHIPYTAYTATLNILQHNIHKQMINLQATQIFIRV